MEALIQAINHAQTASSMCVCVQLLLSSCLCVPHGEPNQNIRPDNKINTDLILNEAGNTIIISKGHRLIVRNPFQTNK